MDAFQTALDDLDGLHEAFCALSDTQRASILAGNANLGKKLRRQLAAALDAYVSTVISTSRGELEPMRLDAFLNAVRWGAVSQTDTSTLQAPFRSGIEIEDYQLDTTSRTRSQIPESRTTYSMSSKSIV